MKLTPEQVAEKIANLMEVVENLVDVAYKAPGTDYTVTRKLPKMWRQELLEFNERK